MLLAAGADIQAKVNSDNDWTPLHATGIGNSLEAATLLIESGAEVNAKTKSGYTPLDLAISSGKMQSLLRQHGGECNNWC